MVGVFVRLIWLREADTVDVTVRLIWLVAQ